MPDSTNSRKSEVIDLILRDRETDREAHAFDRIRLIHRALPERDLGAIDASTTFMGKRLSFPLLISCMTGGDDDRLRTINRNLAAAAEAEGVAMGVGSQRVMFTHPESRDCFEVRRHAPTTLLFSNLGAVQLNYGFGLAEAREAVRVAGADALVFHLNPLQEAVQPEGNTNFTGLADKIGRVASELGRPVVVKEVGAGLSAADVERLLPLGVRYFDVAGSGGTSWSRIEHHRRDPAEGDDRGLLFQDWGIPTPVALERLAPCRDRAVLIASGGIRNGLDMAKAVVLGASLCGLARPFLAPAMESADAVRAVIGKLRREFVTAMFLLGEDRMDDLFGNASLRL